MKQGHDDLDLWFSDSGGEHAPRWLGCSSVGRSAHIDNALGLSASMYKELAWPTCKTLPYNKTNKTFCRLVCLLWGTTNLFVLPSEIIFLPIKFV